MEEKNTIVIDELKLKSFLDQVSYSGLEILYAFAIAYKNKIAFSIQGFCKETNLGDYSYYHGFSHACELLGIIGFTTHKQVYNIVGFNKYILDNVEKEIFDRAKENDKTISEKDKELGLGWMDDIKKLEAYFNL